MEQFLSDDSEARAPILVPAMTGRSWCWQEIKKKKSDSIGSDNEETAKPSWKTSAKCRTFGFNLKSDASYFLFLAKWLLDVPSAKLTSHLETNRGSGQSLQFVQLHVEVHAVQSRHMRWISCQMWQTLSVLPNNNTTCSQQFSHCREETPCILCINQMFQFEPQT